jgi:hypothetical protein
MLLKMRTGSRILSRNGTFLLFLFGSGVFLIALSHLKIGDEELKVMRSFIGEGKLSAVLKLEVETITRVPDWQQVTGDSLDDEVWVLSAYYDKNLR